MSTPEPAPLPWGWQWLGVWSCCQPESYRGGCGRGACVCTLELDMHRGKCVSNKSVPILRQEDGCKFKGYLGYIVSTRST